MRVWNRDVRPVGMAIGFSICLGAALLAQDAKKDDFASRLVTAIAQLQNITVSESQRPVFSKSGSGRSSRASAAQARVLAPVMTALDDSRILIGFHFRKSVEEGTEYGRKIGKRAANLYLRPVH